MDTNNTGNKLEHLRKNKRQPKGLTILHEDKDILVVEKPAGLLTIGTERNKSRTVHYLLNDYVRKGNPKSRNRIYVVHRLDQDTSGILLFAKSEPAKKRSIGNRPTSTLWPKIPPTRSTQLPIRPWGNFPVPPIK